MLVICLEFGSIARHQLRNRVPHDLSCIDTATFLTLARCGGHVRVTDILLCELLFAVVNVLFCRCRLNVDL